VLNICREGLGTRLDGHMIEVGQGCATATTRLVTKETLSLMELSTGLAARPWACAVRTDTQYYSSTESFPISSVMVGWVSPSVHVADSYRSGGGKEL